MRVLKGYFKGEKELCQDDPISSYLFAIVMNMLSCMLDANPTDYKYHDFKYHCMCKILGPQFFFFFL